MLQKPCEHDRVLAGAPNLDYDSCSDLERSGINSGHQAGQSKRREEGVRLDESTAVRDRRQQPPRNGESGSCLSRVNGYPTLDRAVSSHVAPIEVTRQTTRAKQLRRELRPIADAADLTDRALVLGQ